MLVIQAIIQRWSTDLFPTFQEKFHISLDISVNNFATLLN